MLFRRPRSLLIESRRDPDAFAAFYDAYAERVLLYLVRRVLDVDTAFDLLSETFATALARRHQFRGSVERAARPRIGVGVPGLTDPEIERIETLAGINELVPALHVAMAELPEDQRRAGELGVVGEQGYAEGSPILGVSEQTARARVSRGLRTLAQRL